MEKIKSSSSNYKIGEVQLFDEIGKGLKFRINQIFLWLLLGTKYLHFYMFTLFLILFKYLAYFNLVVEKISPVTIIFSQAQGSTHSRHRCRTSILYVLISPLQLSQTLRYKDTCSAHLTHCSWHKHNCPAKGAENINIL